jgi:hypothetical protein
VPPENGKSFSICYKDIIERNPPPTKENEGEAKKPRPAEQGVREAGDTN